MKDDGNLERGFACYQQTSELIWALPVFWFM